MDDFRYEVDADGVAIITWDVPGKSMNLMKMGGFPLLSGMIDTAFADPDVRGVVITSAKKDFSGGVDLASFRELPISGENRSAAGVFGRIMAIHRLLRKIESGGQPAGTVEGRKPVVAALPGTAAGIGLELPLGCHRIICADRPDARFGLPEIRVGLFPGAGGTTRLVRKLGLAAAGPLLLRGTLLGPRQALEAGVIDEIVDAGQLLSRARDWVLNAKSDDLVKPWDRKGFRLPGGAPYDRDGFESFVGASVQVHSQTLGASPAATACMSAIYEGTLVPIDDALKIEARWFTWLLLKPSTTAMIRTVFTDRRALAKGARRPAGIEARNIARLGVIGAGMMGAGIALVAASAGMKVVLLDREQEAADRGRDRITGILQHQAKRRPSPSGDVRETMDRIEAGTAFSDLAGCDLVIEAVFEDPAVKAEVLLAAEAAVGPECMIASNTSTLPISDLAGALGNAERFVGMHFFSPVHRMMLVEIIRGRRTGDEAVARAVDFSCAVGKTPIVVNDARFFYTNRCIIPYLNEGMRMVGEGVPPALVDNAARMIGMPVGPLQLVDETSLDLAANIADATRQAMGNEHVDHESEEVVRFLVGEGRLGRKAGAGFYEYDGKGVRTGLWPGLADRFGSDGDRNVEAARDRLLLIQVIEAVRALEDGVLEEVREGDVGAVLGWGFAPWSGGPFSWLDSQPLPKTIELLQLLSRKYGRRFEPPALLSRMAETGRSFTG